MALPRRPGPGGQPGQAGRQRHGHQQRRRLPGSLAPRRVQLLHELLPKARRIGLIGDVNDPTVRLEIAALAALDPALGIAIPQIVLLQADRVIE